MRRLDETILDRAFQPIADRINRMGISHLAVAWWLVMGPIVAFAIATVLNIIKFGLDATLAIVTVLAGAFCYAVSRKALREIERDRGRQENGNLAVPATRGRDSQLRICWSIMIVVLTKIDMTVLSMTVPGAIILIGDLSFLLGLYLWATYPQMPRPRLQYKLAFATGAA